MSDTTDPTERMPTVPGADGCDQFVDDGRAVTLAMHKGTDLQAVHHGREFVRSRVHHEPSVSVRLADGEGLHLTECNQEDANGKTLQGCH